MGLNVGKGAHINHLLKQWLFCSLNENYPQGML